jgi:intein/homing endonuclease
MRDRTDHEWAKLTKRLDAAWLNLDIDDVHVINPFDRLKTDDPEEFYKRLTCLLMNPEYFSFICKHILNIDLLPMQVLILQEMWNRKFPMLVGSRGLGKTFLLSLYCLLRAALIPNRKIVVVGSAFRQSKYLHDYMENIWKNAPILRDMCDSNSGPRRDVDMCKMTIGSSTISALPIGDGQKIRGQRANDIVADEFACLDKDTLVETGHGLVRVNDLANSFDIITGENNIIENPAKFIKTPLCDVYQITLENGYVIKCSEIHQLKTSEGWKKTLDIQSGDYVEKSPQSLIYGEDSIDPSIAWLMGILVSEGHVNNKKRISVTTTDIKLAERLINEFSFKVNIRDSYIDKRGWDCKKSYVLYKYDENLRAYLYDLGLDYVTSHKKKIPSSILMSSKETIQAFLNGLFDGDGSAFLWKDRKIENNLGLAYYSVSERLCRDVQVLMYKLGYDGYLNKRESKISDNIQWFVRWNNNIAIKACEFLDVARFKDAYLGCDYKPEPSYICKYKSIYKVQMKYLNKKIEKKFKNRLEAEEFVCSILDRQQYRKVIKVEKLDYQDYLYDYFLPKTNSFYADGFKNHNSMSREVFENVIAGFAAVSASPVENVKRVAMEEMAKKMGIDPLLLYQTKTILNTNKTNQIIISGTAFYEFNHFAEYWKRWKTIIETKGDLKSISNNVFNGDPIPDSFKWDDYSIIRIPVDLVPKGFMDEGQIARSKATIHNGLYLMEFGAVFTKDSQGFFKRSLIESCVGTETKPVKTQKQEVYFDPILRGGKLEKYVMAIDPASEVDNFSIVILELHPDHRRIVYCWTTTRKDHTERVKKGLTKENNFYSYCARKIRELMNLFPVMHIAMDAQGGGYSVAEALHDHNQLKVGEIAIWPIIDEEKPQPSDDQQGLHILEMCQFAKYDWYSDANHGLRKDLEDKILLFPRFDPITIGLSLEEDKVNNRLYDTLEDCVMEIEELKNELSLIEVSESVNGRMRWDTPEVKIGVGRKQRMRKDRYSALLMANMAGRNINLEEKQVSYQGYGGFAKVSNASKFEGATFTGPNWFTNQMNNLY